MINRISTYFSFLVIIALLLSACAKREEKNKLEEESSEQGNGIVSDTNKKGDPKVKLTFQFNDLELYLSMQDLNLRQFKKYGTFYTKDFDIYQVRNLDLLEDNLYIKEIYLYFIDNTLHKIQAHTTKNMANFFISKYGGAKMVLKDQYNKEMYEKEGMGKKASGRISINENLTHYLLKWIRDDRTISYLVDESLQKNYEMLNVVAEIETTPPKNILSPTYVFSVESNTYKDLLARVKYDELVARRGVMQ